MQEFPEDNKPDKNENTDKQFNVEDELTENDSLYDNSLGYDEEELEEDGIENIFDYFEDKAEANTEEANLNNTEETEEQGEKLNPKKEIVQKEMDEFRDELVQYRDSHFYKDGSYRQIEDDDDYASLLEEGDLSKHAKI